MDYAWLIDADIVREAKTGKIKKLNQNQRPTLKRTLLPYRQRQGFINSHLIA